MTIAEYLYNKQVQFRLSDRQFILTDSQQSCEQYRDALLLALDYLRGNQATEANWLRDKICVALHEGQRTWSTTTLKLSVDHVAQAYPELEYLFKQMQKHLTLNATVSVAQQAQPSLPLPRPPSPTLFAATTTTAASTGATAAATTLSTSTTTAATHTPPAPGPVQDNKM